MSIFFFVVLTIQLNQKDYGWSIMGRWSKESINRLLAHSNPESIGICNWVIVATKATANPELADILRPLVGEHTNLLTLQNGMGNVENLADAFGHNRRILAGLCFTCINRTSPNVIESLLPGYVQFGEFGEAISDDGLNSSKRLKILECEFALLSLWTKHFGGSYAGMCLLMGFRLLGITTDGILANPVLLERANKLMLEIQAAASVRYRN